MERGSGSDLLALEEQRRRPAPHAEVVAVVRVHRHGGAIPIQRRADLRFPGQALLVRLQGGELRITCQPEGNAVHIDVTDTGGIARLATALDQRYGRLDVLIGNAAIVGEVPETIDVRVPADLKRALAAFDAVLPR